MLARLQFPHFVISFHHALPDFQRDGLRLFVVEKFNRASEVWLFVVQHDDLKTPPSQREQIHAPIGIFLQNFFHRCRAACIHDAFLARQHHAEFRIAAQHFLDHVLVALLENVQR